MDRTRVRRMLAVTGLYTDAERFLARWRQGNQRTAHALAFMPAITPAPETERD